MGLRSMEGIRVSIKHGVMRSTLVWVVLIAIGAVVLLPLFWAGVSSLQPLEEVYAFPPHFSLTQAQWSNYTKAFTQLPMLRFLFNSFVIATASAVGAIVTSSMAGFALARFQFAGRRLAFGLLIASMLIPSYVLLVPRYVLCDALGWMNTYKPLIVPAWLGGGAFNIFLFRQFFRMIPRAYDDAASLDGATTWQIFRHVILPIAKPAVVTVGLLSFIYHWQDFLDPLIYLSDFETFPVSLGLRMYQSMAGTWANLLMAASLIALLPVAMLFFICQRHVMRTLNSESDY